jgi:hypothetical protein
VFERRRPEVGRSTWQSRFCTSGLRQATLRAMAAGKWRTALLLTLLIDVGSPSFALAQSSPAPLQVPSRVLVHIESPEPVDLERGTGDFSDPFYVVCTSPCDTWVPATSWPLLRLAF